MTDTIERGQTWRSRDPRDGGRTVTVLTVDTTPNGYVTVQSVRRSTMRKTTLRTRYKLVEPSPLGGAQ